MNAKAKIQAQLSAYLDGELDEAQLRQVEEALENDGDLRAELANLAAARKLLRDLPAEKPPADLVSRVLAEAERSQLVGGQHAESSPSPLRWIRYAASAAVLLVAAALGMVIAITLCSTETYTDNLTHHSTPGLREDMRDDKAKVAVADRKLEGIDEDADRDRPAELKTRGLLKDVTPDGRELGGRHGGTGAGGHGLDGKLGIPDDNGRSGKPGFGGTEVSGGTYDNGTTTIAGTRTKIGAGNLLTKSGDSSLTIGGNGDLSGGNKYNGVTTVNDGTMTMGREGDHRNGALSRGYSNNNNDAASGTFDNVDNMSRVLAGNMTNNTIIYTDRLDQTQRQIETVLNANGIAPVVARQSESAGAANKTGSQAPQARGNFYVANTLSPAQVQYEAYVTPEQMAKVQKALDSVRAKQNVSQDVPALAYNGTSAKDGGWGYKQDQAGKYGFFNRAGRDSNDTERAGIAIASVDDYRSYQRKVEALPETPLAKAARPGGSAGPAPEPAPAAPLGKREAKPAAPAAALAPTVQAAMPAKPAPAPVASPVPPVPSAVAPAPPAETGRAARPATIPPNDWYDAPAAKNAPPAPVVVAPDLTRGEVAREKAKRDVQTLARGEPQPAEELAKKESTPAEKPAEDKTPLGSAITIHDALRKQTTADEAQSAKASESGSGLAAVPRGQSTNDPLLGDAEKRRAIAQTRPATTGEKLVTAGSPGVAAPSVAAKPVADDRTSAPARSTTARPGGPPAANVAAKPESTPPPNQAAKFGDLLAESRARFSTRPGEQRLAGQAAGPVGGQRATGLFNPPTTAPASAPATIEQQEQIVQVGMVRQAPLTQSGGTVVVRFASPPGRAHWIKQFEQNLATANVQKLVITLNYRQAGENPLMFDRAAINPAASSQAAPAHDAPAANRAQQESQTQSK